MDGEGDESARTRRPGAGPPDPDPDLDAQIADLAAELQFDETEAIAGLDGLDDFDDDEIDDIEELDADIDELAEVLPPEPRRLYLQIDDRVHVVEKERFVIGRVSGQSDLAIIDANVSRQHCAIERRDDEFYVKDLGSTNGIEVEGLRVDDHRIREGEVLVLSGHEIRCSFTAPIVEVPEPHGIEPDFARADAPSLTGEFPPIPSDAAPEPEPEPEQPEDAEWPESYEERMELRLHLLATEVSELRGLVRELVTSLDALKVDALASLIQNRLQKAKPR